MQKKKIETEFKKKKQILNNNIGRLNKSVYEYE